MLKKAVNHRKLQILIAALIVLEVFAALFWHIQAYDSALTAQVIIEEEDTGAPVRLIIPAIDLHADIINVALTTDDSMDVPTDPLDAGWYELGPRPGEIGSAVIDGHVNWWYGATGVFADLHKLKPGDLVTVQDDKGTYIYFKVREIRTYDAAADTTEIFSSNDGKAHLNLITCSGVWNRGAGQYSERLVIFTDKE